MTDFSLQLAAGSKRSEVRGQRTDDSRKQAIVRGWTSDYRRLMTDSSRSNSQFVE
jgi:hypothetical protein